MHEHEHGHGCVGTGNGELLRNPAISPFDDIASSSTKVDKLPLSDVV